ncbi:MAG: hypothetical protein QOD99_3159 [Chthoniobacter sp.]|jgi:outer membrane biosynthesis protein TonB|nr:hypothetical protein [Chthoniobacter sp.]
MIRLLSNTAALVALFALAACETQQRRRPPGNKFGYQGTETQTMTDQVPPPPTDQTENTAPPDTTPPPPPPVKPEKTAPNVSTQRKDYPYGTPIPGKPGFVTSPHAPYSGYVDVRGFPPGTEVKDPYTGKIFLVP